MRRRDFLALMGIAAGSAAMYRAMTSLSVAAESTYAGPIRLDGDPKGTSIIILGAGLAGMVAAFEFFHETRRRRIDRGKEQKAIGSAPDVCGDSIVRDVPIGGLGL